MFRKKLFARTKAKLCVLLVLAAFSSMPQSSTADDASLWKALRSGGHAVLLRHALAPGTADPPEFELRKCATQRNLSSEGRAQAERIGALFRENGIVSARVFSSQWCRCLDTARLLELGSVQELPDLNSFFEYFERRDTQTRAMEQWLAAQSLEEPFVLVTHQVNITALTKVYPASGELVFVRRGDAGDLTVVGTIETD